MATKRVLVNGGNPKTSENSRVQMAEVAMAFLNGKTLSEISHELEIPRNRISRWRAEPEFQKLYDEIEQQLISKLTEEAGAMVAARLDYLGPAATKVLEEALTAEKMSDRISAARTILMLRKETTKGPTNVVPIEERMRLRGVVDVSPAAGD
jgi:transposase-like protein